MRLPSARRVVRDRSTRRSWWEQRVCHRSDTSRRAPSLERAAARGVSAEGGRQTGCSADLRSRAVEAGKRTMISTALLWRPATRFLRRCGLGVPTRRGCASPECRACHRRQAEFGRAGPSAVPVPSDPRTDSPCRLRGRPSSWRVERYASVIATVRSDPRNFGSPVRSGARAMMSTLFNRR